MEIALKYVPELVISDILMPIKNGIDLCTGLKQNKATSHIPIILLSAKCSLESVQSGFQEGADDYITKPIRPKVLISKVKAILKRKGNLTDKSNLIEINGISVDRERYVMSKDDEEFSLPKKEFELLALLMSNPGKVFTRETILNSIWGEEVIVGDRTIDVHIRKLREKVGENYIKTVKGVGYRFEE